MSDPTITASTVAAPAQAEAQHGPTKNDATRAAAQEFEAFFLAQVLDQMFAGIRSSDGPFGGGSTEGVYRQMLNAEFAKHLSQSGGIGVADSVYREMLRLQEVEK
jgi:Rod binding domain-containing protein